MSAPKQDGDDMGAALGGLFGGAIVGAMLGVLLLSNCHENNCRRRCNPYQVAESTAKDGCWCANGKRPGRALARAKDLPELNPQK